MLRCTAFDYGNVNRIYKLTVKIFKCEARTNLWMKEKQGNTCCEQPSNLKSTTECIPSSVPDSASLNQGREKCSCYYTWSNRPIYFLHI